MTTTGATIRTEGPRCRTCKTTEARCAYLGGCCPAPGCTHWRHWTSDGEPIATTGAAGGRPLEPVIDEVTAKRREQWRRRYRQRRAS